VSRARNSQKAMADPVKRAAAQERAREIYRLYLDTPECRAKVRASRKIAGEKVRETRLAWCPPEYRELHAENVNRHRMRAAQSRELIDIQGYHRRSQAKALQGEA
jgi:hypothetical protein